MSSPITIRGITYPSMAAAARALDVTPDVVFKARANDRLDQCGTGRNKARPVEIDGVKYPSIQSASRATGIVYETLRKRLMK